MKRIPLVRCPTLFIHGEKDEIIPIDHSEQLLTSRLLRARPGMVTNIERRSEMEHSKFSVLNDIIYPAKDFLKTQKVLYEPNSLGHEPFLWRQDVFKKPEH